ncbi:MAG: HdeD family acid-resistance protein [Glaciecola sp.]
MAVNKADIINDFNQFLVEYAKPIRNTGIAMVILGLLAMLLPFVTSVAIEVILSVILMLGGFAQIIHAVRSRGSNRIWWETGIGVLSFLIGVLLLTNPLEGLLTLTFLMTIMFIGEGVFKIALAFSVRPAAYWLWLLVSGVLSLGLGIIILSDISGSATWFLGFSVGINFLFGGLALIRQINTFTKQTSK